MEWITGWFLFVTLAEDQGIPCNVLLLLLVFVVVVTVVVVVTIVVTVVVVVILLLRVYSISQELLAKIYKQKLFTVTQGILLQHFKP